MFNPRRFLILGPILLLMISLAGEARSQPPAPAALPDGQVPAPPTLKQGDSGADVETLQRTLNAQADLMAQPGVSPLTVDGDFGEGTRAALLRFQRLKELPPTGLSDVATWKALGPPPPPAAEPELPDPAVVNAEVIPRQPAEPLDAPPAVLSPVWAIADGKTGALLWGENANQPVEMASTTKMMTALIVVRRAAEDARVLDEVVTFSERADRTPGSTSGVKVGETVAVGELLYGLLLPSGNDAATAFAEHFGPRCAPAAAAPGEDAPLARFVAEMNRVAAELGLAETHFDNPHGLPVKTHRSSARDLARLASVALRDPNFARVVNTPRRGATVTDAAGKSRNVIWKNTNRLLGTEGYDGVKTGTTTAAGNCLVASGHRGNDHLILVILGAPTSDARYSDARNLFRYGWLQRANRLDQARQPTAAPVVDSAMTPEEAFEGLAASCPPTIRDQQMVVPVGYWGFDAREHQGQVVVDRDLAADVAAVFAVALREKFPIRSVIPVSAPRFRQDGAWSDDLSMAADNTSSFNYRPITGGKTLSNHALGRAIDINPFHNPYVKGSTVLPTGSKYDPSTPGTLTADHPVTRAFLDRGWDWGGNWKSLKDFQHFEKTAR